MRGRIRALSVVALIALVAVACGGGAPEQREIGTGGSSGELTIDDVVQGSDAEFQPYYEDSKKLTSKADYIAAARKAKNQKWGVVEEAPTDAQPAVPIRPKGYDVDVDSDFGGTSGNYYGSRYIYEYVNDDGSRPTVNCGQAAAATMIRAFGGYSGSDAVRRLDTSWSYGPDNVLGAFGSSTERVRYAIDDNLRYKAGWISGGASKLQSWIRQGSPAVVLLDVSYLDGRWGGHYVVVFGYDSSYYYVTNYKHPTYGWNRVSKVQFAQAWRNGVPWWAGVADKFIGVY